MERVQYNYLRNMITDILDWLDENFSAKELIDLYENRESAIDELYGRLWVVDSVTGKASGSYWFSRWYAEQALLHNWDLCIEAIDKLGTPQHLSPESLDVTIRCYLLQSAIIEALKKIPERFLL